MLSQPPDRDVPTRPIPLVSIWSWDEKLYFIDNANIEISNREKLDALISDKDIKLPDNVDKFYEISLTCDRDMLNMYEKLDFLPHPYAYLWHKYNHRPGKVTNASSLEEKKDTFRYNDDIWYQLQMQFFEIGTDLLKSNLKTMQYKTAHIHKGAYSPRDEFGFSLKEPVTKPIQIVMFIKFISNERGYYNTRPNERGNYTMKPDEKKRIEDKARNKPFDCFIINIIPTQPSTPSTQSSKQASKQEQWQCDACTYFNSDGLKCVMCETLRPQKKIMCPTCTFLNSGNECCEMCQTALGVGKIKLEIYGGNLQKKKSKTSLKKKSKKKSIKGGKKSKKGGKKSKKKSKK